MAGSVQVKEDLKMSGSVKEDKKVNLYQKMAEARAELKGLTKGGSTKAGGSRDRKYFELGDFIPQINELNVRLGMLPVIRFTEEKATLTVYDVASDDVLEFESPMSTASMSGCQPVQNLGAVHTYMRRYMYMLAYEIVASDELEPRTGEAKPVEKPEPVVRDDKRLMARQLQEVAVELYGAEAQAVYKQMLDHLGISGSGELTRELAERGGQYLVDNADINQARTFTEDF